MNEARLTWTCAPPPTGLSFVSRLGLLPDRGERCDRVGIGRCCGPPFAVVILEVGVPAGVGAQAQLDAVVGEGEAVAPGPERAGCGGHLGEGCGQSGAGSRHRCRGWGVGLFGDGEARRAAVAPGAGEAGELGRSGAGVLDQVVKPLGAGAARGDPYRVLVLGQVQVGGVTREEPYGA